MVQEMSFQVILELLLLLISSTRFNLIQFLLDKHFLLFINLKLLIEKLLCLHSMKYGHLLLLLPLSFIIFIYYVKSIRLYLLSDPFAVEVGCSNSLMLLRSIKLGQMLIDIGLRQLRCVCWIQPVYFKIWKVAQFIIILWNFSSKLCLALIWLVFSLIFLFNLLKEWLSIGDVFNV